MRYVKEIVGVVLRKGTTVVGLGLLDERASGRGEMVYALEMQPTGQDKAQTVYVKWSRSKEFYRISVNQPLRFTVGRVGTKPGLWLDKWEPLEG
jgi:hypothetical protein